ncbi:MAG TPA: hypothetical protein VH722_11285 [Alphaproteobacteria bacterium]|nr:hypothetical protein [Alphaproteobacteria bacterium]
MKVLKLGSRHKSAVCDTQVMVIRATAEPVDLRCGGVPMIEANAEAPSGVVLDAGFAGGSLIGKRYIDAADKIELLCTKGGNGSLSMGEAAFEVKQAKALPSSD